ncbi:MAG: DNA helicase [Lentilitoribacter sp.]
MKLSSPIYKLKRQAKLNARSKGLKLNEALDQIAISEGFRSWGHLSSCYSKSTPVKELLSKILPGDMVIIAARPGHGKTLLALELATLSETIGKTGYIFSLDYNVNDIKTAIANLGMQFNTRAHSLKIDTSDEICAEHIINRINPSHRNSIVIIDYLQLLDQKRDNSTLDTQILMLKRYADKTGTTFIFVSQIDRRFELTSEKFPSLRDLRLPNPVDTSCFNKLCFLHDGDIHFKSAA